MSEVVATMSPMPSNSFKSLAKFFKTPKGLLVIALAVLIPVAGAHSGFAVVAPGVAAAAAAVSACASSIPLSRAISTCS